MPTDTEHARPKKMLLVVIDGLGSGALGAAIHEGNAPCIKELLDAGANWGEAISPFPSLTPVCLASIVTGVGPDQHRIPSLSWFNRGQGRFVEYGSSFTAAGIEGHKQTIEDVILNLNHIHLSENVHTIFEDLHDAGVESGAINYLVWRGRQRHTMKHDWGPVGRIARRVNVQSVYGPDHFYFGELYASGKPLLPQVGIKRPRDWGGAHVAKWLVRNTDAGFLLLYLGQHDAASHKLGPDSTGRAIRIADRAVRKVVEAFGEVEEFLQEYALIICADHGQTPVLDGSYASVEEVFDDVKVFRGSRYDEMEQCEVAISPSNRCAMVYTLGRKPPQLKWVAGRAFESPAVDVAVWRDNENERYLVANGDGGEFWFRRKPGGAITELDDVRNDRAGWEFGGDAGVLDIEVDGGMIRYQHYPDALERIASALDCVNTGDVLLSARLGWEFQDIGGSAHAGGSHGSLLAGDSIAPLITAGLSEQGQGRRRLSDIAGMVRRHFA